MFPTKKWIPASQLITEPSRLDPGRNSSTMVRLRSCRCCLPTLGDSMRFCNMLVTEWYEGVMIAISPWIPNIITDQKAWPRSLVVKSFVVPPPIDLRSAPQLQRAVYLSEIRSLVGLERYQSRWKQNRAMPDSTWVLQGAAIPLWNVSQTDEPRIWAGTVTNKRIKQTHH